MDETTDGMFGMEPDVVDTPVPEAPAPEPVAPQPEPVVADVQLPTLPPPGYVPLAALHEVRDELKTLKASIQPPAPAPDPEPMPDVIDDPQGFAQRVETTVEQRIYAQNLYWSERLAEQQHGAEVTQAAKDWGVERCSADPVFNQQVRNSPDPIGFVINQYKRDQVASQVDLTELEQFKAWKAAQAATQPQPIPAAPATPASLPPQTLASMPSAGSSPAPKPDPAGDKQKAMFGM